MTKIERFEDLFAWQEARKLTKDIYRLSDSGDFARDYGLKDQIRRAAMFTAYFEQAAKTQGLIGSFKHSLSKRSSRRR